MKSEDVRILSELNVAIWGHGIKNPPSRVKINVKKDDKGVVVAQLFGVPFEKVEVKKEKKAPAKKEVAQKAEVKSEKPAEVKSEAPAKKAAPKKAVKKEAPAETQ
jgi:ribosomal protein L31E